MIESGVERISLERSRPWRWWLWIDEPGFRFARGGRARGEEGAQAQLRHAAEEALHEQPEFRFRPTHQLGPHGELIPIPQEPMTMLDPAELRGLGSGS